MSTSTAVVGFLVGLLAGFPAASGLGTLVGPVGLAEPGSATDRHRRVVPHTPANRSRRLSSRPRTSG